MGFQKQQPGFYGEPTACVWPVSLINIRPLTSGGNVCSQMPEVGRTFPEEQGPQFPHIARGSRWGPVSLLGAELCQSWAVSGCQLVQPRGGPLSGRSVAWFSVQAPRRRRSSRFRARETYDCIRFM